MPRFRKKPVVIEAVQFVEPLKDDGAELLAHLEGCVGWMRVQEGIRIKTLEGEMLAAPGDWIIKGVKGEFYPCKPDIFAATYSPDDGSEPASPLEMDAQACIDILDNELGMRPASNRVSDRPLTSLANQVVERVRRRPEPPYPFCRAKHRAECIATGRCQSNLKDGRACND